jgi:hypothetical protein
VANFAGNAANTFNGLKFYAEGGISMTVSSVSSQYLYGYLTGTTSPNNSANVSSVSATTSNASSVVTISQAAASINASQGAQTPEASSTAVMNTDQGNQNINLDTYFSPSVADSNVKPFSLASLPPLLLPNPQNIEALNHYVSTKMPQFLSQNGIPSAPSSITYDANGQMQLPSNYQYASQFKVALAKDPTMARALSTTNALASQYAALQQTAPFSQAAAAATTPAEQAAVTVEYAYLLDPNHKWPAVGLAFNSSGQMHFTADGQPYII